MLNLASMVGGKSDKFKYLKKYGRLDREIERVIIGNLNELTEGEFAEVTRRIGKSLTDNSLKLYGKKPVIEQLPQRDMGCNI